jgi:hypothetical protein
VPVWAPWYTTLQPFAFVEPFAGRLVPDPEIANDESSWAWLPLPGVCEPPPTARITELGLFWQLTDPAVVAAGNVAE